MLDTEYTTADAAGQRGSAALEADYSSPPGGPSERRTKVAARSVQRAGGGGFSRQRDRAKMRFIAGGR
jgi:hypothetical protein